MSKEDDTQNRLLQKLYEELDMASTRIEMKNIKEEIDWVEAQ